MRTKGKKLQAGQKQGIYDDSYVQPELLEQIEKYTETLITEYKKASVVIEIMTDS